MKCRLPQTICTDEDAGILHSKFVFANKLVRLFHVVECRYQILASSQHLYKIMELKNILKLKGHVSLNLRRGWFVLQNTPKLKLQTIEVWGVHAELSVFISKCSAFNYEASLFLSIRSLYNRPSDCPFVDRKSIRRSWSEQTISGYVSTLKVSHSSV